MGGWGCPHEVNGKCQKVNNLPCDPGMKGCVLFARFRTSAEVARRGQQAPGDAPADLPPSGNKDSQGS